LFGSFAIDSIHEIIQANRQDIGCISDIDRLDQFFENTKPDVVINCIAYNRVNDCETEYEIAYKTNAIGPLNLAKLSTKHSFKLFHYSTSYVFDGKK
jgi:dTDP-4-dehydrorhamnose reductase